jgi:two-component system sensor histidine kinase SenX3
MSGFARRRAARAAAAEFDAFETVAASVIDVIASAGVVLDQFNTVIRSTPGAVQLGLVQGRHLIHSSLVKLAEAARVHDGVQSLDVELETGLGREPAWVHARASKFADRYVMLVVEDRTEARKLEETRRDFVANVSHELKTPIGAIGLLAEAIQNATDEPEMVAKFTGSLIRESHRLGQLVQEVIQLSKVQGAKLQESAVDVNLAQVVADSVERNSLLAEQRNVKITTGEAPRLIIHGDYEMLTTALRNLIENAVVYSEPGSQVGVGLREVSGVAEISVTDSGIGIPESEHDRIFERFYRVDPSRSRETGGTGLGLSIVKHAAANHGGEVRLFSRPGLGSTFTLRLPINPTSQE